MAPSQSDELVDLVDEVAAVRPDRSSLQPWRDAAGVHAQIDPVDVTVRFARIRDWPVLHHHVPQLFPEVNEATLSHWLRNERLSLLVAEVDGQFAGFCHLRVRRQGAVLWINYVATTPEQRRRGVAHALLRCAQECAAAWGCMRAELDVVVRNTGAVAFYDRTGYRCITTLVDDLGRVKYRYRKEVHLGRVEHRSAPGMPPRLQRIGLRLLYAAWIAGPQQAQAWIKNRSSRPPTDFGGL
ncbi:MAG: N-acetyltransferase family protein [Leptothrix sp. (in: b-proteobacteria)]